jgi:hypothetical protein
MPLSKTRTIVVALALLSSLPLLPARGDEGRFMAASFSQNVGAAPPVVYGGQAYSFGEGTAAIFRYDMPTSDTVTLMASALPTAILEGAGAASAGGAIYVFGGEDASGNVLTGITRYDPVNDTIQSLATGLPRGLMDMGIASDGGQFVYLFGGIVCQSSGSCALSTARATNAIWRYDTSTGTTTTMSATLQTGSAQRFSAVAAGAFIYVFGGEVCGGCTYFRNIERYNPAADAIATVANMATALSWPALAYNGSSDIFVMGGFTQTVFGVTTYDTIQDYNLSTNTIRTLRATLPTPGFRNGAWIGGYAYVLGGDGTSIERYDPAFPGRPFLTATTPQANDTIDLSWTDAPNDAIDHQNVYREDPGASTFSLIATLSGSARAYRDVNITVEGQYHYEVSTVNAVGESPSTPAAAFAGTPPSAPQNPGTSTVIELQGTLFYPDITWSPPASTGGLPITAYDIYRGTSSGGETFLVQVASGPFTDYVDHSCPTPTGFDCYYQVSAVNAVGEGPRSAEVQPKLLGVV